MMMMMMTLHLVYEWFFSPRGGIRPLDVLVARWHELTPPMQKRQYKQSIVCTTATP